MSGRKKNRKHRHGQSQPPHELLSELNSLHELLGSDMEADIPLLDQVASPNGGQKTTPPAPKPQEPRKAGGPQVHAPLAPPPPLEEADLPILFSPIDEELTEEYAPALSEADKALLRPLQDLPRTPVRDIEEVVPPTEALIEPEPVAETVPEKKAEARAEFQPGLFDAPRKQAVAKEDSTDEKPPESPDKPTSASSHATEKAQKPVEKAAPEGSAPEKATTAQPPLARAASENPFLPPHIRARLTGGRIPKPEPEPAVEAMDATEPQPDAEDTAVAAPEGEPGIREQLIEQLMAEQLPELERQLRANITALVDEIYPEED
ncbi:hypothetical protein [Microbulbifer elongatus]|uniref:hypothetical protein n=1 Tax=Microbulbifer elongatus TaxID=86173 RepID=UPI001E515E18|nr:hypothetical protein [Microbulbifer elongatus]